MAKITIKMSSLNVIIIEKTGVPKSLLIKEFNESDLFKKCGFKKSEDFVKQTEWNIKLDGKKYYVSLYAKSDGRANSENKYDFPPPVDSKLFFGSCALVAKVKNDESKNVFTNLTIELWTKMYDKLFGGFEDLSANVLDDDNEEDELDKVSKDKKTKHGYLKDGFVVDSSDGDEEDDYSGSDSESEIEKGNNCNNDNSDDDDLEIEDIGSELSEEEYDYPLPLLEKVEQNEEQK
jgi:hypothetical protein